MGLYVALIDHIHAIQGAQLVEPIGLRIVRGADGVEVVLLEQDDVLLDGLAGHRVASHVVMLVHIHAYEYQCQQQRVLHI